jgi:hypothetical protein
MKFKTKLLSAAVLAAVGATSAQAVTVSNDGLGQVLLYPYYTVEGGYNTLISVVNTTSQGKAVKVRFLESLNSREVLDFNLYLSPFDVWTAMVTEDATTGGAKVVVADNETSCTVPAISKGLGGAGEQSFLTYGFDGTGSAAADARGTDGYPRTRSGYVELIEMGDIDPEYVLVDGTKFLTQITHSAGVVSAAKCGSVAAEWDLANTGGTAFPDEGHGTASATGDIAGLWQTSGGLVGTGTLINVAKGTDYSYDPVPLAGFNDGSTIQHTEPGNLSPSLAQAIPTVSTVVLVAQDTGAATVMTGTWGPATTTAWDGVDAVSAALMRTSVINEYVVNTAIHAGTDWVVTFPTKRWYVDGVINPVRPFSKVFGSSGACESITLGFYDQEERKPTGTIGFSPAPAGKGQSICWEANVVTFNNSNVLASTQTGQNVNVGTYPAGWMTMGFPESTVNATWDPDTANTSGAAATQRTHQMFDGTNTYSGLPVIGFAVQQYVNDVLDGGVLSNYGGSYAHKYLRSIAP